jgi:hypothetical protein
MAKSEFLAGHINIGVDNGNSLVKYCYDKIDLYESFPNVVESVTGPRSTILNQGNQIDLIDVEIVSPSIPESFGRHFYVGNLASRANGKTIIGRDATQMKSRRPQTVLTILTAIAISVANKYKGAIEKGQNKIRANVNLGTGLPISEIAEADSFSELLTKGTHYVKFLSTPGLQDVSIELSISLPDGISVDDVTGMIDIAAETGKSLMDKTFGVADIGGVDMDIAFFNPGLILDDLSSGGGRVDLNNTISKIRQEFNSKSKQELISTDLRIIEMLVKRNYDVRHTGKLVGNIQEIANDHLKKLAESVFKEILNAWNNMPDAEEFHFIGGGSLILGPFIRDINDTDKENGGRPLIFDDEKYSQLRNLRGTFRSLLMALNEKGAAAATTGVE